MTIDSPTPPSFLVVDDQEAVIGLIAAVLGRAGSVTTARSGELALEELRARDFDVILSDLNMDAITGFDVYAWLLANRPSTARRLILMSGDTDEALARDFARDAGIECLAKPFELTRLLGAVDRVLAAAGQHAPIGAAF